MPKNIIYHITTKEEWTIALADGIYKAASLDKEGFIHCCTQEQVPGVLVRYFNGKKQLLALSIDADIITAPIQYEFSSSLNETFPHIYGAINIESVLAIAEI